MDSSTLANGIQSKSKSSSPPPEDFKKKRELSLPTNPWAFIFVLEVFGYKTLFYPHLSIRPVNPSVLNPYLRLPPSPETSWTPIGTDRLTPLSYCQTRPPSLSLFAFSVPHRLREILLKGRPFFQIRR